MSFSHVLSKYRFQERLDEAGKLYEQAIEIQQKAYGPDDRKVATLLSNQAILLLKQVSVFERVHSMLIGNASL